MELNLVKHNENQQSKTSPKKSDPKQQQIKDPIDDQNQSNSWSRKRLRKIKESNNDPKRRKVNLDRQGTKNQDFSSSLFSGNPTLPTVHLHTVQQKCEPVFSVMNVSDMKIHPHLISCLENRLNIKKLTAVQQMTIPTLLDGKEALIKSQTGSGKTLAYAIPIMHDLQNIQPQLSRTDGVHAIIILPTRELALQTYECFHKLSYSFTRIVPGCFSGGEKKKSEKARIRKGITILISTPGRLIDHIQNTATLGLMKVRWLVLDEADRLLDMGYEKDVTTIVDAINNQAPSKRTVMLSATLSSGVEKLAHISMDNPEIIDISSEDNNNSLTDYVMPSSLKHCFVFVPTKLRLVALISFLCEKCLFTQSELRKAVVFLPTLNMVDFYYKLLTNILSSLLPIDDDENIFYHLHGNMKQDERVAVFNGFRDSFCGVLLTTDVAARGLELPNVDWIIQISAPAKTEDYIHRVGRTARIGSNGHALIFLLPSENNFITQLEANKLNLTEIQCDEILKTLLLLEDVPNESRRRKVTVEDQANALQLHFEKSVMADMKLHELAKDAYLSYIRSYASYPLSLRSVLPFKELHLGHVAKSFCLRDTPKALGAEAYLRKQKQSFHSKRFEKPREKELHHPSIKLSAVDTV